MKNLIFTLTLLMTFNLFSQNNTLDSSFVYYWEDELEGKKYFTPNYDMIVANSEKTKGAKLSCHINHKGNLSFLTAKLIGLGNCVDKNELIILFSNGEKCTIKSWNDFNCEGNAYFNVTSSQRELLSTTPIKTIRVRNGDSYESVTSSEFGNPRYFIQLFHSIDNKEYTLLEE